MQFSPLMGRVYPAIRHCVPTPKDVVYNPGDKRHRRQIRRETGERLWVIEIQDERRSFCVRYKLSLKHLRANRLSTTT